MNANQKNAFRLDKRETGFDTFGIQNGRFPVYDLSDICNHAITLHREYKLIRLK